MKRYRFRLEPVLRVRLAQEDAARASLLAARARAAAADEVLEERLDRYARLPHQGAAGAEDYLAARFLLDAAAATVVAAGKATQLAWAEVGERRDALQAASTRVAALERLDGRRREEHGAALRREEDAVVDEIVTARHARGQR